MARGSLGAGGSLSRFTGQGLRSTLLFPFFILWQKDTDPLGGGDTPISGGSTSPKGSHASAGRRGVGCPTSSLGGGRKHLITHSSFCKDTITAHATENRQLPLGTESPALPVPPPAAPAKRDAPREQGQALRERENASTLAKVTQDDTGRATIPLDRKAGGWGT